MRSYIVHVRVGAEHGDLTVLELNDNHFTIERIKVRRCPFFLTPSSIMMRLILSALSYNLFFQHDICKSVAAVKDRSPADFTLMINGVKHFL